MSDLCTSHQTTVNKYIKISEEGAKKVRKCVQYCATSKDHAFLFFSRKLFLD